ncbi:hypothetical protein MMC18_004380 [Xylographa bjoerkii]|nr:hypothetical protein [Xylographa bjoerkii]
MDPDYGYDAGPPSRARPADETPFVGSTQNHSEASRILTPSSSLLQDRLREKKAEKRRMNKMLGLESSDTDIACSPREIQSSPFGPIIARTEKTQNSRRPSGLGLRSVSVPKEMGLREMEEYFSKITKLNFDLKLEIVHRRQQTLALEKRLEKMETLEAKHVQTQNLNDELLQHMEKREQAIQEAVAMICELEERIEKLEVTSTLRTTSTIVPHIQRESPSDEDVLPLLDSAHSRSAPKTPDAHQLRRDRALPAIQSSGSIPKPTATTSMLHKTPLRKPSFLKSDNGSARALRSLYLAEENNLRDSPSFASTTRPLSFLSGDEYGDADNADYYTLKSPALSVLSKSSFMSIYGTPESPDIGLPEVSFNYPSIPQSSAEHENNEIPQLERRKTLRLHKWIDDKESPLNTRRISPRHGFTEPIVSIGSMLNKQEFTNEQSTKQPTGTIEPLDKASEYRHQLREEHMHSSSSGPHVASTNTLLQSPKTISTANESLRDGPPTLAPSHSSQEQSTRPNTATSDMGESICAFSTPEWDPKPRKPVSFEEDAFIGLDQGIDQESPELPIPWTGTVATDFPDTPSATASLVPQGTNMMLNDSGYLPTQYGTPSRYKYYPPHRGSPPRITRDMSRSSESEASPSPVHAGRNTEEGPLRFRNSKQTPSPLYQSQLIHEFKNPEAQHYQRLVTPPSDPRSTMAHSDTDSKLPHVSSYRTTTSSLSGTPLLPSRPNLASRMFTRSKSHSVRAPESQQENSPPTQHQSFDVSEHSTGSSKIAPTSLPQAPRTPLHQGALASRIARPGTVYSEEPRRIDPSLITSQEALAYYRGTTTGEEGFLTSSTNSHDDFAVETRPHNDKRHGSQFDRSESQISNLAVVNESTLGRKWGKGLGRTASLKIKKGFGWKKGEA